MSSRSKFLQWIDYRVRVTIQDYRMLVGTLLAFDKHLNLVLSDTEEFRRIKPKKQGETEKEMKRVLGMIILRGDNIVSITAEAPPIQQVKRGLDTSTGGPGKAQPITRTGAIPIQNLNQTPGLQNAPKGLGQPNPNVMMPGNRGPGGAMIPGMPPVGLPPGLPPGLQGPGMMPPNLQPSPGIQPGFMPPPTMLPNPNVRPPNTIPPSLNINAGQGIPRPPSNPPGN